MFLDISEDINSKNVKFKGEQEALQYVDEFLKSKELNLGHLGMKGYENIRNELIAELRKYSNLSIRQIASVLNINRGMVQRVKKV